MLWMDEGDEWKKREIESVCEREKHGKMGMWDDVDWDVASTTRLTTITNVGNINDNHGVVETMDARVREEMKRNEKENKLRKVKKMEKEREREGKKKWKSVWMTRK